MMRATFDTNILVSGVIRKGKPHKLLDHVADKRLELVISKEILDEFVDVIKREKLKLTKEQQNQFIEFITNLSSITETVSKFKIIKEDPDDDKILDAAYDGKADYIVSGDSDLLNLKGFEGIKIVTASEMMEILERKR